MTNTITIKQTLSNLISKTNEVRFITICRKACNTLAALFTVLLCVQYYESKTGVDLAVVSTAGVLALMYALANKCQTHLLKLRIESLINGNEISVYESSDSHKHESSVK